MSDIKNQLIKDSYNYVLQSDLSTGIVYRIGGDIPVNPTFLSGLTINSGFTFQNGTEFDGYVLTCDSNGYASWKPVSSATGNYLSISGGTLGGDLTVPNILVTGITATTISATTYYGINAVTGGTYSNGVITLGGTGNINTTISGLSTTTLQQAYDNSSTPEIVINSSLGGLSIKNGTGNADNVTNLLEGINTAGSITSFISADGSISGNGITGNTLNAKQTINFPTTTGSTYGVINQEGRRLLHTYGTRNIFLGNTSGNFTASTGTTGITDNIGIGVNTLNGLTTGKRNIGIGLSSLISTTTGTDNIGIGNGVLQNNITSSFNTGVGQYSLQATTSSRNTGIGYQSLFSNVTGASNVAIGHNAGYNETGSNKLHIANTDTKTLIYGEFDNNRVGINTSSLSNAFTVSGSTDPIKLIGLQPANDNNLLTVDGTGVVHTYSLTELTASTSNLYLSLSGGTVSGRTTFQSGLTANAITATTISSSTITANAITAATISASTITATTITSNAITATTISASTYSNLPNTLYTGDGSLSSNRTVNQSGFSLTFTGTTGSSFSIIGKFNQGSSSSTTTGLYSHTEGLQTTASGGYSHAEGGFSYARGLYSHAEGTSTADGVGSHSEGNGYTNGSYSHAEGYTTVSNGDYSHSEGYDTRSNGHYSHAEGYLTRSSGQSSHAEGYNTDSNGNYSHSEGYETNANGDYSHSEGAGYIIDGSNTFEPLANNPLTYLRIDVSGVTYEVFDGTWVSETEIVIIGDWSTIPADSIVSRLIFNSFDVNLCYYGPYYINKVIFDSGSGQSVVTFDSGWGGIILNAITGCTNISNGIGSHSEGLSTRANGNYSHSEGIGTYADGEGQHVSGKYNITGNTTSLFVIGNGTDDDNRSDILNVNQNEVNVFGNLNAPYISGGTFFGNGSGLTNVVNSITTSTGLSGSSTSGNITLINTLPDQTVTITGGTNIQVTGTYPNFGIAVTGATSGSGAYLPLSGGTLTGGLVANSGLTANIISQTHYIDFTTGITNPSSVAGRLFFDNTQKALSYFDITNNQVPIAMGQQLYTRVWNATGVQIDKGKVIAITGTSNNLPSATLARNVHTTGSDRPIGLAAENIPNGSEGLVLNNGILSGITLNTFSNGDTLYLSDTIPGGYVASTSSLAFTARTNEIGYVLQTGSSTGKIYVNINNEDGNLTLTDKERNILEGNVISGGVYEYTGMTQGTGQTINVALARGWIVKNTYEFATLPDVINVYYPGGRNIPLTNLATADATFILINSGSTLVQQTTFPTPQQRRENIFLGKVVHPLRNSITSINQTVDFDVSPMAALRDLWTPLKLINQGIIVSPHSTTKEINTSSGILWGNGVGWITNQQNPNSISISGTSPTTFQYRTRLGPITGGTVPGLTGNTTLIVPDYYDLNGVVTAVGGGSNSSTNQRVFLFPTGLVRIQLGQVVYGNLAAAVAGSQTESFTEYSLNRENGILIGIISVNKNATNLSDPTQAVFNLVSKFGEIMGGTGGLSTTTLQQAYDNSATPEIVTNSSEGPLSIKNGAGTLDNVTNLLEIIPSSTTGATAFIRADGLISGSTLATPSFTANANGMTATTISATTYYGINAVTGGTYSNGTITLGGSGSINTTISGLPQGTITAVTESNNVVTVSSNSSPTTFTIDAATGGTYSNGVITLQGSGTLSTITGITASGGGTFTGGTVTGGTYFSGGLSANTLVVTATTDPVKFVGLQSASDTDIVTTDGTGVLHTRTLNNAGIVTWSTITSSQTGVSNNGYITNSASQVVITLPSTGSVGSIIEVVSIGTGGWRIAQQSNHQIHFGIINSTSGATGNIQSTQTYDAVKLLCTTTNNEYTVLSSIGNIDIN